MQRTATLISCVLCAAAFMLLLSCNIVGPLAIAVTPPPSKDAEYELADRPTTVFVDDRQNVLGDRPLRRYIGDRVCEVLQRQDVLKENIPIRTRDAMAVAGTERSGDLMSVEEIGREVGAEQLIYVEMMRFDMLTDADRPVARAMLRVRVLDIPSRTQVYPRTDVAPYREMSVDLPSDLMFTPQQTRASAREAELALCNKIADDVSKLFYKHPIRPLGASIDPSEHIQ